MRTIALRPSQGRLSSTLTVQFQVIHALMLHDIKSRFFGNGLGYFVSILWPIVHILVILLINSGRVAPHGVSMVLYATTAVIPYICCNYIGRFITLGVIMNKSFLQYPIIRPLDLMAARIFLELISNSVILIVVLIGLDIAGISIMPAYPTQACLAWLSSLLLGVGFGLLNGVITMAVPLWNVVFMLFIIIAWITCGLGIDPEALPYQIGYYLSFNPVLHAVEWMRQAYYVGYSPKLLSKEYLISFSLVCFVSGLIGERVFRGFLVQQR